MDSVRSEDVHERTMPNLMKHSCVSAFSSSSWTLPVHASLFSGLNPTKHDITRPSMSIKKAPFIEKLGDICNIAGFSENPYFSSRHGFDKFTDYFDDDIHLKPLRSNTSFPQIVEQTDSISKRYSKTITQLFSSKEFFPNIVNLWSLFNDGSGEHQFYGKRVLEHTSDWLNSQHEDSVAFINLFDAHQPHLPTEFADELGYSFTDKQIESLKRFDGMEYIQGKPITEVEHISGFDSWDHFFEKARHAYQSQIRYLDSIVGEFISQHPEISVIVTSDHGQMLGEEGWFDHHGTLHPRAIRVPLISVNGPEPAEGILHEEIRSILSDIYSIEEKNREGIVASDGIAREVSNTWEYSSECGGLKERELLCRRVSHVDSELSIVYESPWNSEQIYTLEYEIDGGSRTLISRTEFDGELAESTKKWLRKTPTREATSSVVTERLESLGYA